MTDRDVENLKKQGFVKLGALFSAAEIDGLAAETDSLVERLKHQAGRAWIKKSGAFVAHLYQESERVKNLAADSRLVKPLIPLLGPDINLYWDQAVYKNGPEAAEFPWHQDNGYGEVIPAEYFTYWIALCDVPLEKGALWVIPESHTRGPLPHHKEGDSWVGFKGEAGFPVPLKKGEVLLFSSLTLHRSSPNRTADTRSAYIVQYCRASSVDGKTGEPFTDRALLDVARNGKCLPPNIEIASAEA